MRKKRGLGRSVSSSPLFSLTFSPSRPQSRLVHLAAGGWARGPSVRRSRRLRGTGGSGDENDPSSPSPITPVTLHRLSEIQRQNSVYSGTSTYGYHYYGQLTWSLRDRNPYIKPTSLKRTLIPVPLFLSSVRNKEVRFDCIM